MLPAKGAGMSEHQPFASLEYRLRMQQEARERRIAAHPLINQLLSEGKTLEDVFEIILQRLEALEEGMERLGPIIGHRKRGGDE